MNNFNRIEEHYRNNNERLVLLCNKYLRNYERSEDVVQEAYTRALTYSDKVPDDDEEFAKWFQGIINNCIRENWKAEKSRGMSLSDPEIPEIPIKSSGIPAVILSQVKKRIEAKAENVATILTLHFIDGYNAKEVAELVPETANNIRTIVHRFRQEIREEFRWVI